MSLKSWFNHNNHHVYQIVGIVVAGLSLLVGYATYRLSQRDVNQPSKAVTENKQSLTIQSDDSSSSVNHPEVAKHSTKPDSYEIRLVSRNEPLPRNPVASKTAKPIVHRTEAPSYKRSPANRFEDKSDSANIERAIENLHMPPPASFNDALKRLHTPINESRSIADKTNN